MPTIMREVICDFTSEELLAMPREEVIADLTERQRLFCEYYIGKSNVKIAAIKAGYAPGSAHYVGWRIRNKTLCNRYICWLKMRISKSCHLEGVDLVDMYARIAFADITDFLTVEKGKLTIVDSDRMDGQIVKKIKKDQHGGITIELEDRKWAMDKLEHYFDVIPKDWKRQIEERKVAILEEKLALEKRKSGEGEEFEDDGFLEAIGDLTEEVWENYTDPEEEDDNE